jgi:hypothetical protein
LVVQVLLLEAEVLSPLGIEISCGYTAIDELIDRLECLLNLEEMTPEPSCLGRHLSIRCPLWPLKIGAKSLENALLTFVMSSSLKFG